MLFWKCGADLNIKDNQSAKADRGLKNSLCVVYGV